jgi:hypothetical protein
MADPPPDVSSDPFAGRSKDGDVVVGEDFKENLEVGRGVTARCRMVGQV